MPSPVADAAPVERTAAPGNLAEPVITPSTPLEYLLSRSLGTTIDFLTSLELHLRIVMEPL
jgi:hypothetical protein